MGKPFTDESNDLVLNTRDIVDSSVVSAMCSVKKLGQEQYDNFVTNRLVTQLTHVNKTTKRNIFYIFSCPPVKEKSRTKYQLSSLKNDCSLFCSLYISCQTCDGDIDDFFSHEKKACLPSLSSMGKLRLGKKSKLRVVFDASAKTTTGHSLNDQLLPTPSLYPLLSSVLTKFCSHPVALSSDISKMFREVLLDLVERDYHRFLCRAPTIV